MSKFMKPRNAMLALASYYKGDKEVIMKNIDDGASDTPHSHTLVAGTNHFPCKATAALAKKKIAKRSKSKSLVKVYHYNHLRPTTISMGIPLDETVANKDIFRDPAVECKA